MGEVSKKEAVEAAVVLFVYILSLKADQRYTSEALQSLTDMVDAIKVCENDVGIFENKGKR